MTAYFDLRISEDDTTESVHYSVKEHQMKNGCHHLKYNLYCLIFACEIIQIGNTLLISQWPCLCIKLLASLLINLNCMYICI